MTYAELLIAIKEDADVDLWDLAQTDPQEAAVELEYRAGCAARDAADSTLDRTRDERAEDRALSQNYRMFAAELRRHDKAAA